MTDQDIAREGTADAIEAARRPMTDAEALAARAEEIWNRQPRRRGCAWCADPASDYEPADPDRELCRAHLAEHEGLSPAELDRMDAEQAAEEADTRN